MSRILLFGGTTEGRELSDFLKNNNIPATVSVVTEFGAELLNTSDILVGKLDCGEIKRLLQSNNFSLVIDATHPFAVLASENIRTACQDENVRCLRLLREGGGKIDGVDFSSVQNAADYLDNNAGNALITTGSKELSAFCSVNNYSDRFTIRVLPAENIVEQCIKLGFKRDKIITERGPFSVKQNLEHLKKSCAEFLITKESGAVGGFNEKAEAASVLGVRLLVIRRPDEYGFSLEEIKNIVKAEYMK